MSSPELTPRAGLRERKKARTRAAIQEHALRLFAAHGYATTTVEQIAEAAEVSPSTFFRYFPTKEDVVLHDRYDPLLIASFRAQPAELGPIQALRRTLREVYERLPPEQLADERVRQALIVANPELRARVLDQYATGLELLTSLLAERTGRDPAELELRTFAGAVFGALLSAVLGALDVAVSDQTERFDAVLAYLEDHLSL